MTGHAASPTWAWLGMCGGRDLAYFAQTMSKDLLVILLVCCERRKRVKDNADIFLSEQLEDVIY